MSRCSSQILVDSNFGSVSAGWYFFEVLFVLVATRPYDAVPIGSGDNPSRQRGKNPVAQGYLELLHYGFWPKPPLQQQSLRQCLTDPMFHNPETSILGTQIDVPFFVVTT
jgi:hypothetical protein